jgi:hypothetical protein
MNTALAYADYSENRTFVFSGHYFFTGPLLEYADQPGPVSKTLKNAAQEWLEASQEAVEDARGQSSSIARAFESVAAWNRECRIRKGPRI